MLFSLLLPACTVTIPSGPPDHSGDVGGGTDTDSTEEIPGDTAEDTGGGDTGGDTGPDDDDVWRAFYDIRAVQEIEIELTDEAMDELNSASSAGESEYVEGNVLINGDRFDQVGVRLKGSSTYETFEYCGWHAAPCKPSFKIKLDEFVLDQKLGDMERLTFNNMTYDVTQAKETIDYRAWEEGGMTVPKTNYAHITVNGDDFGLYTNIETMDDEWIKHRYGDATGDLWGTASSGGDFGDTGMRNGWQGWVLKSGEGDKTRLTAVKRALDGFDGDFFGELDATIDTVQFLDFWAWNIAVGNQDGYPYHANDVFIYADPDDGGRFDFSPWGMDEAWDETLVWNAAYCRLASACSADSACVGELRTRTEIALSAYEAMDVLAFAQESFDVSQDYMLEDPRRPYSVSDVEAYRAYLMSQIEAWPARMRAQMGM